jgi:hypothetical protein
LKPKQALTKLHCENIISEQGDKCNRRATAMNDVRIKEYQIWNERENKINLVTGAICIKCIERNSRTY